MPCSVYRYIRIMTVNFHSQMCGSICKQSTYCSESYYSERFSEKFRAYKRAFAGFYLLCNIISFK